jgi:ElaB/YqjD/DUF883 family membrane-anchored ribosome-binding protein
MENQVNTAVVEKTPEQIEQEMLQTRESLTEKVAALENQVVGTVQTAANTLTETVDAVKSFVETAPDAVSDKVDEVANAVSDRVRRTFDISGHVQENPWAALGVSVGLGFLAGLVIFRGNNSSSEKSTRAPETTTYAPAPRSVVENSAPSTPREPGFLDEVFGMVGQKVKEVAKDMLNTATTAVTENIRESIPKLVQVATEQLIPEPQQGRG